MTKAELIAEAQAYVFQNSTKQVTAANLQKLIIDIINAMVSQGDVTAIETIDLADPAIYDWTAKELTIPADVQYAGVLKFACSLYDNSTSYSLNNIVKSSGSDGGTADYCYRSLANSNLGNLLSDGTKWELADANAEVPIGAVEISTMGDPSSLPTDHSIQFEVTGMSVRLKATAVSGISTGQLALETNTDAVLTGYGFIVLADRSGIARKVTSALLQ